MAGPRRARETCKVTSEKLAISLPREVAQAARDEAQARGAASLSAFVAEAVEEKLEANRLQRLLDEMFSEQPMTEEEREWADKLLDASVRREYTVYTSDPNS
jgi:hypothetical protein